MSEITELLEVTDYEPEPHLLAPRANDGQVATWWAQFAAGGSGGAEAREQLIAHFAPLVTQVAGRMIVRLPDTVELGDLVSYGIFGLIDAVEKFEPARGLKFETYAGTRVRGAIIDELRAMDWVPRSVRAKARAVAQAIQSLEQSLHRPVRDDDIAAALAWDVADVRSVRAQVALSHVAALDGLGAGGTEHPGAIDGIASLKVPGASDAVEHRETHVLLAHAIQGVREREQEVLRLYYFENLTLSQIGKALGVTESRVSQIHSGAVRKLRDALDRTGAFG